MPEKITVSLSPLGKKIEVDRGAPLRDVLFDCGVEFPCGGRGECRGCRVRVLEGALPVDDTQRNMLGDEAIAEGWRLSCQCRAEADLKIELGKWNADILVDHAAFEFTPRSGYGIAIDLGTTTLVAQLLDLETGAVVGVRSALNSQARHGADVMSRIGFAIAPDGLETLTQAIRSQLGRLIESLVEDAETSLSKDSIDLAEIVVAGNTAMSHLFCGIDVTPLSAYPFEPEIRGERAFSPSDLGWSLSGEATVRVLASLGGFVGGDILAGLLATGLHESPRPGALVDLGTNGEIVVARGDKIVCASTAAGPAFEGATIAHGMRASTGAIHKVEWADGGFRCRVLGNGNPRGLCGSGLVDAVAVALESGGILPSGRIASGAMEMTLASPIVLTQCDIRQLQLAKGAIAAGLRMLAERVGLGLEDLDRVYLAGAFGNYVNTQSAETIGLLKFRHDRIHAVGNSALLGAKLALFDREKRAEQIETIRSRTEHVSLSSDINFQEIYAEEMVFPDNVAQGEAS